MKRKAENQLESPDPQKKLPSEEQQESSENKEVQAENNEENKEENKGEETEKKEISKDTNISNFSFFTNSNFSDFASSSKFSSFTLPSEQNSEQSGFKSPFSFPSTTENPFANFSGGALFSSLSSSDNGTSLFPFSTPPSIESSENNTPTLQEAVNVITGEEDEDHIFVIKAKAFRFVKPQWKERGQGCLKVNSSKTTGKSRIVMRNDKTLQLILNVPLVKESRVKKFGEKDIQLFSVDLSEGQTNPNYAPILIRVKSSTECSDLYDAITKQIPDFKEKNEDSTPKSTTSGTPINTSESSTEDGDNF